MVPVILLVGRLPSVVEDIESQLDDLPIEWLGAHDREEVIRQLEAEPNICSVIIGAGLDDTIRGDLIGIIASRRPDICIHLKDRKSGPAGMAPFVRRVVSMDVLRKAETA
ncbi:MAG: hypothetical protein HKN43_00105 [Rhodothermales bacterium]|nr:hypothetical protein [Rhodothermales bacterium]